MNTSPCFLPRQVVDWCCKIELMSYPYQYLEFNVRLSFRDAHGLDARIETYQRIRALRDGVRFLTERIWGEGDLLFDYAYAPISTVSIRKSPRGATIIDTQLARPLLAGQEFEMYSTRTVHHGFKNDQERWEFGPVYPTSLAKVSLAFPIARDADALTVSGPPTAAPRIARPGAKEINLFLDTPPVGSLYAIDWTW